MRKFFQPANLDDGLSPPLIASENRLDSVDHSHDPTKAAQRSAPIRLHNQRLANQHSMDTGTQHPRHVIR
jgi:hypothetical protein